MFDVAPTELMLVAFVALMVIGPKELPKAMRFVGQWVGKARAVTRQFRAGFDNMVREAELAEMEKKWAEENARIMREFPSVDALPAPYRSESDDAAASAPQPAIDPYADAPALQTARPDIVPDRVDDAPAPSDPQPPAQDAPPASTASDQARS